MFCANENIIRKISVLNTTFRCVRRNYGVGHETTKKKINCSLFRWHMQAWNVDEIVKNDQAIFTVVIYFWDILD